MSAAQSERTRSVCQEDAHRCSAGASRGLPGPPGRAGRSPNWHGSRRYLITAFFKQQFSVLACRRRLILLITRRNICLVSRRHA